MDLWNNLSKEDTEKYINLAIEHGTQLLGALAVFVIGRWVAKILIGFFKRALKKADADETLVSFLSNIAYAALLTFVVITSLGTLGVNTTSFAAVIAAAGLAIGLALQGSLSNFASGVLIIIFKPFKKGDFIEAAGVSGSIVEVTIFTTKFRTGDNKIVIAPNATIMNDTITNFSNEKTRRIDMVFGIGYDDDMKLAKKTLEKVLAKDDRILKDPAPSISIGELADSSVNIKCRPWVKTDDYWGVHDSTLEAAKEAFDKAGISIPYPQQDVYMHNVEPEKPVDKKKK